jgi:D-sedoheptulose 7-phosphate isomerase
VNNTTTDNVARRIQSYLTASSDVTRRAAAECASDASRAAAVIAGTFEAGGKLLICGNGGSAADSQHIATEFTSTLTRDFVRRSLPAVALTTDTSFLTAYANDFEFDNVFARQVEGLGRSGDTLFCLSTSGNSKNIVRALEAARGAGMRTVLFSGGAGGRAAALAEIAVLVPSTVTGHIQEAHIALAHALCAAVESRLFPEQRRKGATGQ